MRHIIKGIVLAAMAGVLVTPSVAWGAPAVPCDDPEVLLPGGECAVDVEEAVASCCPCDDPEFGNHGQYVRCVAQARNVLREAGCLDAADHDIAVECAAHSTCNMPDEFFTTCCLKDSTCVIMPSVDQCDGIGGTPGTTESCCTACSPSGAFLTMTGGLLD